MYVLLLRQFSKPSLMLARVRGIQDFLCSLEKVITMHLPLIPVYVWQG